MRMFYTRLTALIACWFWPLHLNAADRPANQLAIGDKAQPSAVEIIVPTAQLQNLNYKTKSEVLALRSTLVNEQPQLLAQEYLPSDDVFGRIEDGKPWWGLQGEAFWGTGKRSIEGDSEESRFFLNPFILVGANTYAYNIWDKDKITEADLADAAFPYNWKPTSVRLWPAQSKGEVVYGVSEYNQQLEKLHDKLKEQKIIPQFGLVAYNARDFGYHWLWVEPESSSNIECLTDPKGATEIEQFIHCGNSCGYPGGCNNMSKAIAALDQIKYKALPAVASVQLWKNKPKSIHDQPDMTFVIRLQ